MAKIANNLTELIGGTPLMKLAGYSRKYGLQREVVAKLESFNPAGSVKDRVGLAMIEDAEARGALKPGATIIEPTSGNTGVGLAMVATIKGYHLILTMPETMSIERRNLLKALGAEIVLTDGIRRSTEETFQQTVTGYDSVKVDNSSIQLHGGKAKYALFPVWLLSTSWRGENYLFAMNGQTGKFVGDLPVDKGAARKWMLGLTAALSAASYGVMWLLWLARIL